MQCAGLRGFAGSEMSGDWIKMRGNLWDDPRITKICELTEQTEATIVGACYWLWATADQHTANGTLEGMSLYSIDRKTGVKGFAAAMVHVGWIADSEHGVQILRFEDHNGTSAKKRAQTAKRVSTHRSNDHVTHKKEECNASSVTGALAREEKRRIINTPIPPGGAVPSDAKKKTTAIALKTFLSECKAKGEKPIPDDDSVFDYAERAGVTHEILALHWAEFRDRYTAEGAKKYKSWRIVFGKSVRGNWFKLWYFDQQGQCTLTSVGVQAKNIADAAKRSGT